MRTVFVSTFLFFWGSAFCQVYYPTATSREDLGLKGNVKTITLDDNCKPSESFGLYTRFGGCYYKIEFNPAGFISSEYSKHASDHPTDTTQYAFLNDTLLISIRGANHFYDYDFIYNNELKLCEVHTLVWNGLSRKSYFKYNALGLIEESMSTWPEKKQEFISEHFIYVYDSAGRVTSIAKVGKGNKALETKSFEYNDAGQLLSTRVWTVLSKKEKKSGSFLEYLWKFYTYDSFGNISEESTFIDADKKPSGRKTYTYNESNQLILITDSSYFRGGGWKQEIEYDSLGNKKLVTNYHGNAMSSFSMYIYDEFGNLIEETTEEKVYEPHEESGKLQDTWKVTKHIRHEYDLHGNWIKKYYLDWDGTEKLATRTITYYE